jgi:ATP-binding cassette subfamily F protein 3
MLTAHQIYKSYGIETILSDISFSVRAGEKVALIGPNGCGKTTLLRILAGKEQPDRGQVTCTPGDLRLGYLAQGFEFPSQTTCGELIRNAAGDLGLLQQELAELASRLAIQPQQQELHDAYDRVLNRVVNWGPSNEDRLRTILSSLELDRLPEDQTVDTLSGGQKTRLSLALVLLQDPQLLLLDEPTNHLDISMLEWLEHLLSEFPGGALIVSHDRTFLNRTVSRTLDINPESHTLKSYPGNYETYLDLYLNEIEKQWGEYKDQVAEIRRMQQDIARTKEQARWVEITTTSRQPTVRRYAKKVAQKALSREKKLDRYLASAERVEKPKSHWQMKLEFGDHQPGSKQVLFTEDLAVGYPGNEALLTGINVSIHGGERIVLSGPNGSGKTTLVRTLAGHLDPLRGRVQQGQSIRVGYMTQEQERLEPDLTPLETIQRFAPMNETEARSYLHFFLFSDDGPLRQNKLLSFGERARLSLAALVVQGCGLLLLDEPINHLDIPSREQFEQALAVYEGAVLAVVHDRYFIERFAHQVWQVADGTITRHVLVSDIET